MSEAPQTDGALPFTYWLVENGQCRPIEGGVIQEGLLAVYVNGQELATIMCSPLEQKALALGFLFNEGVIQSLAEVGWMQLNTTATTIDIFLTQAKFDPPRRLIITSGCGGGISFQYLTDTYPPLESSFSTTPDILQARMKDMQTAAQLYQRVRGVHIAALADTNQLWLSAEDVGRHNAVDKVTGLALLQAIETPDKLLLTSGRISSEMLAKARRMGIPVVISRTAPTSTAVKLAHAWQICVVGYARRDSLRVYTHPYRLGLNG